MNTLVKRGLALALVLVLCLGLVAGVTASAEENGSWVKVTNASTLKAGDKLIIASSSEQILVSSLNEAKKYFAIAEATFEGDKLTNPDSALVLTLGGQAGAWTLENADGKKVALVSGSGNARIGWADSDNVWTIAIDETGTAEIENTVREGSRVEQIRANKSASRMSNYDANKTNQPKPELYKLEEAGAPADPFEAVVAETLSGNYELKDGRGNTVGHLEFIPNAPGAASGKMVTDYGMPGTYDYKYVGGADRTLCVEFYQGDMKLPSQIDLTDPANPGLMFNPKLDRGIFKSMIRVTPPTLEIGTNKIASKGAAVQYVFTPEEDGTYIFDCKDANAVLATVVGGRTEGLSLPAEFDMKAGEKLTISVSTEDFTAHNFDITVEKKAAPVPTINTIAEALAAENGDFTVKGEILYIDGKNIYIQDATGAMVARVKENPDPAWVVGGQLQIKGARETYNGLPQLNNCVNADGIYTAATPAVTPIAGGSEIVKLDNLCHLLKLTGSFEVTEVFDNNGTYKNPNITIQDAAGNKIVLYKAPAGTGIQVGDTVTSVTGVLSIYRENLQILCDEVSDIVYTHAENPDPDPDPEQVSTIAEALAAAKGTQLTIRGELLFIDGKNLYLADETGAICARLSANPDPAWKVGDIITATGSRDEFKGLKQLNNCEAERAEGTPTVKPITGGMEIVTEANISHLVKLTGSFTVKEVYDNNGGYARPNITIQDAEGNEIVLYKAPADTGIVEGDTITSITGLLTIYDPAMRILCNEADDIVFTHKSETVDPNPDPDPNPDEGPADTGDTMPIFMVLAVVMLTGAVTTAVVLRKKSIG